MRPGPGRGRYDERYITLQSVGKGAFGFVKVGQRRSDGLKVTDVHCLMKRYKQGNGVFWDKQLLLSST